MKRPRKCGPTRFDKCVFASGFVIVVLMFIAAAVTTYLYPKPVRITLDNGGDIDEFYENYSQARLDKTQYIIDGLCFSSCTMIVALIPNDRVCVTPYAKLAFHSAKNFLHRDGNVIGERFSREGTQQMWRVYPENIRELLRKKGWDGDGDTANHPDFIYVEGDELLTIFKACPV